MNPLYRLGGYLLGLLTLALTAFGLKKKVEHDAKKESTLEANTEVLDNVIDAHKNDAKVNKASESELDDIGRQFMRED